MSADEEEIAKFDSLVPPRGTRTSEMALPSHRKEVLETRDKKNQAFFFVCLFKTYFILYNLVFCVRQKGSELFQLAHLFHPLVYQLHNLGRSNKRGTKNHAFVQFRLVTIINIIIVVFIVSVVIIIIPHKRTSPPSAVPTPRAAGSRRLW